MKWKILRRRARKPRPVTRPRLEGLEERVLLTSPPTLTVPGAQSVVEGASISLIVSATDPNGYSLTFGASGLPVGLSINTSSGLISGWVDFGDAGFLPPAIDGSLIDVNDGAYLVSASLTWTVGYTNRLPNPGPQSNAEGQSVSLSMAGTDNVPGDTLSYSASSLPAGLSIDAGSGVISGIPLYSNTSAGVTATLHPIIELYDTHLDTNVRTLTWTITDTNRFPSTSAAAATVGASTSLSMAGTDNVSSDTLSYSATGLPAGLSMNSSTGLISGTPSTSLAAAGSVSLYTSSLTLMDNNFATDHQTLTWYVTNPTFSWSMSPVAAPSITNPGSQSSAEDQSISLAVAASDPSSYSLTYVALDLPAGLSINASTGVIAGTVGAQAADSYGVAYPVQLIAVDGHGGAASASFSWTISPTTLTPSLSAISTQSDNAGNAVSLQVAASDADGNTLLYTATGLPEGVSIDPSMGLISGTVDRSADSPTAYEVTMTVYDGESLSTSASLTFALSVSVANHAPVLPSVSNQVNGPGDFVDLLLSATDADSDALTYSASGLPSGLTLDPFAGEISGTVSNAAASSTAHSVTVVVSDGQSAVSQALLWTVNYVGLDSPGDQSNVVGDSVSLTLDSGNAGGGPFAFTASGLPAGLSINPSTGLISGVLTTAAASPTAYTVSLTADNGTNSAEQTLAWSVGRLSLTSPGDQFGAEGHSVSVALSASDVSGTPTYSASNLPTGLSVNSSTGLITGTVGLSAHLGSPFAATVDAHDGPYTVSQALLWNIAPEVALLDPGAQSNAAGDSVSLALTGGTASGTLSYSASGLPSGLTVNSSTGLIGGTLGASTAQSAAYVVAVTAGNGTAHSSTMFDWTVATLEMPQVADQSNLDADSVSLALGAHYHGTSALAYSASGLPSGLTLNTSSGLIHGTLSNTADVSGSYEVDVTATAGSNTLSQYFEWDVEPLVSINTPDDQGNVGGDTVSLAISASDALSGSLTYSASGLPAGLSVNSSTGLITGTISNSAVSNTPHSVTLTVNDATLGVSETFNWTVAEVGLAVPDGLQTVKGESLSLTLDGWAADGGSVTYSATGLPAGLSINASTGIISGTPTAVGDSLPNVTIREGTYSTSQSFEWDNLEVGVIDPGDQTNQEGQTVSLALEGATAGTGSLTYSASDLPDGLTINPSTGLISGTLLPGAAADGPFDVDVAAGDGTQASQQEFTWTINPYVSLASIADQTNTEGNSVSLSLSATDSGMLSMTYSASGLPGGLSINSTGLIHGTVSAGDAVAGPASVTVTVADATYSTTNYFNWTISPSSAPAAPSATSVALQCNQSGEEVSVQVLASDAASYTLTYSASNLPDGVTIDPNAGLISGTVADDAASPTPYGVTVSVEDGVGETTSLSFEWLVNPSPIQVSITAITAVEGEDTGTITLGTFTTPDLNSQAGDFDAEISWGDGNTMSGTVSGANGSFTVTGEYLYQETGTVTVGLSVTDDVTGGSVSQNETASISNASWTLTGGFEQSAIAGQSGTLLVGTIQDDDQTLTASDFSVSISPGDGGSATTPEVTSIGDGLWAVYSTYTYDTVGIYSMSISVTGPGVTVHTTSDTVAVGQIYAGVPSTIAAGSLAVLNPSSTSGDSASISNGDGTSNTTGTITGGGPTFSVSGQHTYAQDSLDETGGYYPVSLSVSNGGSSLLSTSTTVTVVRPQITMQVANATEDSTGNVSSQTVATFEDPDISDTSSEFTATITWGDGTTSTGTITEANGLFVVTGSHSYSAPGEFAIQVGLSQSWSTPALVSSGSAMITPPPPGGGLPPPAPVGVPPLTYPWTLSGPQVVPGYSLYWYWISVPYDASLPKFTATDAKIKRTIIRESWFNNLGFVVEGVLVQFDGSPVTATITATFRWNGNNYAATLNVDVVEVEVIPRDQSFEKGTPDYKTNNKVVNYFKFNNKPVTVDEISVSSGQMKSWTPPESKDPGGLTWTAREILIPPSDFSDLTFITVGFIQEATVDTDTVKINGVLYTTTTIPLGKTYTDTNHGSTNPPWYSATLAPPPPGLRTGTNGEIGSKDTPYTGFPIQSPGPDTITFKMHFSLDVAAQTAAAGYWNNPIYGTYKPGTTWAIWGEYRASRSEKEKVTYGWSVDLSGVAEYQVGGRVEFNGTGNPYGVNPPNGWSKVSAPLDELVTSVSANQALTNPSGWKS